MKNKNKVLIGIIVCLLIISSLLIYLYLSVHSTRKPSDRQTIYSFDSDTIIVTKYDSNKLEEDSVVIKRGKREELLKIFENAHDNYEYDGSDFNYQYKLDFANGITVAYLNVNDMIFKTDGFYDLTEEDCEFIESLFD